MSSNLQDETQTRTRRRRTRKTASRRSDNVDRQFLDASNDELAYPAVDPFATEMDFRVDLTMFRGPLDLLLYLVRKHELDVMDIPISLVTEQYCQYLEVLEDLNVDEVGDFIEMASLLIEIKSRMVLPHDEDEQEENIEDDPRQELVQRLLEYKKYKDVASTLKENGREWQQRYTRVAQDLPPRTVDPAEQPIHEVELWDLVSAVGRIMRERERLKPLTNIVYDDTPQQVYMQQLHERLIREDGIHFTDMFELGMHKSRMIGIFLAILELVRNYGVVVEQVGMHGDMILKQGDNFRPSLELTEVFSDFDTTVAEPDEELVVAKPR